MKDKILHIINRAIVDFPMQVPVITLTAKEIREMGFPDEIKFVDEHRLIDFGRYIAHEIEMVFENKKKEDEERAKAEIRVEKVIFVEDGSIDIEKLEEMFTNNPTIKIVVYRQGAQMPIIKNITEV